MADRRRFWGWGTEGAGPSPEQEAGIVRTLAERFGAELRAVDPPTLDEIELPAPRLEPPDGLASLGGYPGTDEEGREMQRSLDRGKLMADMFAAYEFLRDHEATTKVGATGFCYGGGVVNALAVAYGDLGAAAPYYGSQPEAADVPAIEAPVQLHYAGLDERVNAGWPAYEEALKASGKTYEGFIYEGANHGFHNDTTPRYDEAAATLAWDRTLAFFGTHLS